MSRTAIRGEQLGYDSQTCLEGGAESRSDKEFVLCFWPLTAREEWTSSDADSWTRTSISGVYEKAVKKGCSSEIALPLGERAGTLAGCDHYVTPLTLLWTDAVTTVPVTRTRPYIDFGPRGSARQTLSSSDASRTR